MNKDETKEWSTSIKLMYMMLGISLVFYGGIIMLIVKIV